MEIKYKLHKQLKPSIVHFCVYCDTTYTHDNTINIYIRDENEFKLCQRCAEKLNNNNNHGENHDDNT